MKHARGIGLTVASPTPYSAAPAPRPAKVQFATSAGLALIVAEDRHLQRWAGARLRQAGFDVLTADDGMDALAAARCDPPDLVLLDHLVAGVDVRYVIIQLRRDPGTARVPILLIAPYASRALETMCRTFGVMLLVTGVRTPRSPVRVHLPRCRRGASASRRSRELGPWMGDSGMSSAELRPTPRPHGVLVADDEALVRYVLNDGLQQEGFSVWLAADGREALEVYRNHRETIDVVLLDVRMPGFDGPQTLAALRDITPGVRCCFMSGHLGGYTEQNLCDLGAATVFAKPFQVAEVAHVLGNLARNGDIGPWPPPGGNQVTAST